MTDERPKLVPVSPRRAERGLPMPPRVAVIGLVVALAAFTAGLQVNATRVAAPSSLPSVSGSASLSPEAQATPSPTDTPVVPPTPLPLGLYHLTQAEANEIALASQFYTAYNAHQLATVMSLLSAQPHLSDCDYVSHAIVTLDGRTAIEGYLQARFADHDHWTVEFIREDALNADEVVVLPFERSNDTLRRIGAPGGVKRSFPELFYLTINPDRAHLDAIRWNTMSGSVGPLCGP